MPLAFAVMKMGAVPLYNPYPPAPPWFCGCTTGKGFTPPWTPRGSDQRPQNGAWAEWVLSASATSDPSGPTATIGDVLGAGLNGPGR